ncbi:putative urea ABC transporter substrate-binding protein [Pectobacterium cacticida]|uniref:putative urea ABC transporter substrate-binding protein n=1 Tax=Pectobacterium cacticida TaxID=69221 RepID=UPI0039864B22
MVLGVKQMAKYLSFLVLILVTWGSALSVQAKETYKIAWTLYAGSMPLSYAQDNGILKKWGDKYGLAIEAVQMNDYIEAQTQFRLGAFAGSIAMSLDALTIIAAGGLDTTVVLPLSASNGSDGIVMRGKNRDLTALKGQRVNVVELSGSHYMLARALDSVGMSEADITVVNTSDSDIGATFADDSTMVVVSWKPQLSEILRQFPDTTVVFDSSKIPNELVDVLMVNTDLLKQEPNLGKALAGAWYEAAAMLNPAHPKHAEFVKYSAGILGTDPASVEDQFSTISFFNRQTARDYVTSQDFKSKISEMAAFSFNHGLFDSARDPGFIGIEAGDGTIIGSPQNVKLRFPTVWMGAAK